MLLLVRLHHEIKCAPSQSVQIHSTLTEKMQKSRNHVLVRNVVYVGGGDDHESGAQRHQPARRGLSVRHQNRRDSMIAVNECGPLTADKEVRLCLLELDVTSRQQNHSEREFEL